MDTTLRKKSKILTLLEFSDKSHREIATLSKVNQSTVAGLGSNKLQSPLKK